MRYILWGTAALWATVGWSALASAVSPEPVSVTLAIRPAVLASPGPVTAEATVSAPGYPVVNFWVENPSGVWHQYLAPTGKTAVVIPASTPGSYVVEAYAFSQTAWNRHDWSAGIPSNRAALFVACQATLAVNQTAGSVGQTVTATAVSQGISSPQYQLWVENPAGAWSRLTGYSNVNSASWVLSQMGTYHVIGYVKTPDAPASAAGALATAMETVTAYGSPAGLTLGGGGTPWVADGHDPVTVPIRVVDAVGDTVGNANGIASVTLRPAPGTSVTLQTAAGGQAIAAPTTVSVPITNGLGRLTLDAGTVPGTLQITASLAGLAASETLSQTAQVPTAITLSPQDHFLIANESGNPAAFAVNVVDQAGYPMLSGSYPLNATILGDTGQFHDLTQGPDSVTVVGGNGPTSLTVYSIAAGLGPMTLNVTGTGLTSAQVTIPALLGGQPAQMGVSAETTSLPDGQSTTLSLTELTKSGGISDPASLDNSGYTVTIEDSTGNGITGGFTLNGVPYTGPVTFPTAVGPNYFYAISQPVSLAVTTASVGTYYIVVSDPSNLLKPSTALPFHVINT